DARNGLNINEVIADTMTRFEAATLTTPEIPATRSTNLPRRKADIQKFNFVRTNDPYIFLGETENGLIQQYGGPNPDTSLNRVRREVFRRPLLELGFRDSTAMGGIYVDRELYSQNTTTVALFRYFLEPLGVSVDKWSMNVRGRSRAYTFADVFGSY